MEPTEWHPASELCTLPQHSGQREVKAVLWPVGDSQ